MTNETYVAIKSQQTAARESANARYNRNNGFDQASIDNQMLSATVAKLAREYMGMED